MPNGSQRLSIADLWDETASFVRREGALLLPVAFATIGLGGLLLALATPEGGPGQVPGPGPWMLMLVPFLLLWAFGQLAIATLTLHGGVRVADAMRAAVRRVPAALGALALVGLAMTVLMTLLSLVGLAASGSDPVRASGVATVLALPFVVLLWVRLLTLFPVLADRTARPWAAIRTASATVRGAFWRLLGASILYFLGSSLLIAAVRLGLGSVLLLAGRQFGTAEGARALVLAVVALLSAGLQAVWCVFTAVAYRRLASASNGI